MNIKRLLTIVLLVIMPITFFARVKTSYADGNDKRIAKRLVKKADGSMEEYNDFIYIKARYRKGDNDSHLDAIKAVKKMAKQIILEYKDQKINFNEDFSESFKNMDKSATDVLSFSSVQSKSMGILSKFSIIYEDETTTHITIVAKTKYIKQKGVTDPPFHLKVIMQKKYTQSEPVIIKIYSAADAYINVLSVDKIGKIYPLFPNSYNQDNKIKKGITLVLPTDEEKEQGLVYYAEVAAGEDVSVEWLKVIASKSPFSIEGLTTYQQLMEIIVARRRDEIEYYDTVYKIIGK